MVRRHHCSFALFVFSVVTDHSVLAANLLNQISKFIDRREAFISFSAVLLALQRLQILYFCTVSFALAFSDFVFQFFPPSLFLLFLICMACDSTAKSPIQVSTPFFALLQSTENERIPWSIFLSNGSKVFAITAPITKPN